jgi:NAD(P)-dependent dehydrogenase (short-subunit alcohol dehydrogenase family)
VTLELQLFARKTVVVIGAPSGNGAAMAGDFVNLGADRHAAGGLAACSTDALQSAALAARRPRQEAERRIFRIGCDTMDLTEDLIFVTLSWPSTRPLEP